MEDTDQSDEISALAQNISELANDLKGNSTSTPGEARVKLPEAARKLTVALESPPEAVFRLAITLRLFRLVAEGEKTAKELAAISGAEQEFIVRIMRVPNCVGYIKEIGEETYVPTPITHAMTVAPMEAAVKHNSDYGWAILSKMPEYFRRYGYRSPCDSTRGLFQHAFDTQLTFWDYVAHRPEDSQTFNTFMQVSRTGTSSWVEWFPIEERIITGFQHGDDGVPHARSSEGDGVLLVDVGGGHGHDLRDFRQKFPGSRGRLVLQDRPSVIAEARKEGINEYIEMMEHDFFTPQPVNGTRAYFFHFVFHDWPDSDARRILQHVATAMTPGYSKLILNEAVLPNQDWPLMHAVGDIHILALLAAAKRSQKRFEDLVASAGLKIVRFWDPPDFGEGVIEMEREVGA